MNHRNLCFFYVPVRQCYLLEFHPVLCLFFGDILISYKIHINHNFANVASQIMYPLSEKTKGLLIQTNLGSYYNGKYNIRRVNLQYYVQEYYGSIQLNNKLSCNQYEKVVKVDI